MKTTVEELIKHRSFSSLTAIELEEVGELCSGEEDFLRMKQFLLGVETMSQQLKTEAGPSLKTNLDHVFAAKHPGARAVWNGNGSGSGSGSGSVAIPIIPLYRRNWVRAAAVALLIIGSAPFFLWQSGNVDRQETPQLAKLEEMKTKKQEIAQPGANPATDSAVPSVESSGPATGNTALVSANGDDFSPELDKAESDDAAVLAESSVISGENATTLSSTGTYSSAWSGNNVNSGLNAPGKVSSASKSLAFGAPKSSAAKESFADGAASKDSKNYMNRGMIADLEPSKGDQAKAGGTTVYTRSMAEQPAELFELLIPAF